MREAAEAIRADVRTAISPVPLYPYQRHGTPPKKHAQLYADSETRGRRYAGEYRPVLYLHLYAERENELHEMYEAVRWIDGKSVASYGSLASITYGLNTKNVVEDPDETMHMVCVFDVTYHREEAGVA